MRRYVYLLLLLAGLRALAIGDGMSFRHYTSADGLPSNCIRDIMQDSCGFVWFATDGGLARFDGHEFKLFKPSTITDRLHIDNYVSSLAQSGRYIWVATDNGLMRYDRSLEQLHEPKLVYPDVNCPRITGTSRRLTVDHAGNLWVGMSNRGVFKVDESLNVTHYNLPGSKNIVGTVYVDKRGEIWATSSYTTDGLYKLDKNKDCFEQVVLNLNDSNVAARSMAMTEDDNNRLWIGLWTDGLVCYDPFTGHSRLVKADNPDKLFHIHSLTANSDGTLFIGTDNGLTVYNPADGIFTLYTHDELRSGSMSGQFVYPITFDNEGGLWVGTFYAGVNYLAPDIKHFESARHSRFVNSVSGNIISSFCEDSSGNLYIGSEDGGLCCYNRSSGTYTDIPLSSGNSTGNVHSLCIDGDDLWIGTYSSGVKIYDTRTRRIRRDFSQSSSSTGDDNITTSYAISRDRQGNIWVATMNSILSYDRDTDTFVEMRDIGALTSDIKQDAAGNLWFSTQGNGLYRYRPHTREWHNYRADDRPGSLIHNHVSCIDFDSRGNLWVATGNGLARYRPETDDFEEVETGATDKMMFFVRSNGNELWIGTGRGLVRYRHGEETTTYTVVDGLANNQCSLNSVYTAADGTIYAGTIDGYTHFDPARIGRNNIAPEIRFTGLDIGGRHVDVGDPRLPCSLNSLDKLELGPDVDAFSITFSALSFANPGNNSYMYRLEGFDKEWMTADNTNKASYTNLPAGDYTLKVKASNNDKVWNEAGISLPIHIAPHWYSSWPMKGAYALITVCLLALGTYLIMRRNDRRHNDELERIKASKEREVYEAKLNFFTTIAHEIRTPVSLIIGPLESIMKSDSKFTPRQSDDIDIIHRNSQRLLFLVNQLLDFKKVESLAIGTKFLSRDIPALIESVAERFRPSLSHRGISLNVELPKDHFTADVDAEALTKLVSNLLNNARKFTKSLVTISCAAQPDSGTFTITVKDDGVGISETDIRRIFKPFVQIENGQRQEGGTGLGLSIVKRVVKAHSGSIDVESQPSQGASFIVTLPLHQAGALNEDIIEKDDEANDDSTLTIEESSEPNPLPDCPVMLVTDDNPDLVRFLSSYFGSNYTVLTAANADEAIGKLETETVDLIVSDWMMPGMSGVDFCRHVRADRSTSHIPLLLLTARTDENSKIEGMNCGADAYVEKPFSIDYLAARISNLLEMRKLLKQKFTSAPLEPIETLAVNPVDCEFLSQLTALIEENFSNASLSVDFLAQGLGISRSGLYAKIRTLADSTPNELIQITRLKRAAQLLSENKYRINEICYMVGFNSPSYFTKCFQRQFGMKPGEFKG